MRTGIGTDRPFPGARQGLRRFGAWLAAGAFLVAAACDGGSSTAAQPCSPDAPVLMGIPDTTLVTIGAVVQPRLTVDPACAGQVLYHYDPNLLALEGDSVRTRGFGLARLSAQVGPRAVTRWIIIVPAGTLAATSPAGIHVLKTDLTSWDTLSRPTQGGALIRPPAWAPGGQLAFHAPSVSNPHVSRVYVIEPGQEPRRLIEPHAGLFSEFWPRYSADGRWVYFAGWTDPTTAFGSLWRARADGSSPELVGTPIDTKRESMPDPSPDGRRIVFASDRGNGPNDGEVRIQIMDLETGVITNLGIIGTFPRWSPTGQQIAYESRGILYVVNPDGTGKRRISDIDRRYLVNAEGQIPSTDAAIDWSPDGAWVVAREQTRGLDLIQVSTGLTINLLRTRDLRMPAWRR